MSENLDLVRSIYARWERGDYSVVDWAHPEIECLIVDGPAPGSWSGPKGMAEGWRDFLSAWEDWRVAVGPAVAVEVLDLLAVIAVPFVFEIRLGLAGVENPPTRPFRFSGGGSYFVFVAVRSTSSRRRELCALLPPRPVDATATTARRPLWPAKRLLPSASFTSSVRERPGARS
jgi:hypothetical protein